MHARPVKGHVIIVLQLAQDIVGIQNRILRHLFQAVRAMGKNVGHGPDGAVVEKVMSADLNPVKIDHTMAFMFESRYILRPTKAALGAKTLQKDYWQVWQEIRKGFV